MQSQNDATLSQVLTNDITQLKAAPNRNCKMTQRTLITIGMGYLRETHGAAATSSTRRSSGSISAVLTADVKQLLPETSSTADCIIVPNSCAAFHRLLLSASVIFENKFNDTDRDVISFYEPC